MIYPILVYKEKVDLRLYAFRDEKTFKHTSRDLLRAGIFDGTLVIDSRGNEFELKNVREVGFANTFWGISLILKGIQIKIDFDTEIVAQRAFEDVRAFALKRLEQFNYVEFDELREVIRKSTSIEKIINCFA